MPILKLNLIDIACGIKMLCNTTMSNAFYDELMDLVKTTIAENNGQHLELFVRFWYGGYATSKDGVVKPLHHRDIIEKVNKLTKMMKEDKTKKPIKKRDNNQKKNFSGDMNNLQKVDQLMEEKNQEKHMGRREQHQTQGILV